MNYYTSQGNRKTPIARSVFMRAEEIDRERAMSGWNPYMGEEETEEQQMGQTRPGQTRPEQMQPGQMRPGQSMAGRSLRPDSGNEMQNEMWGQMRSGQSQSDQRWSGQMPSESEGMDQMQPYFQRPDFTQVLEEQRSEEKDFRRLQSMYPETAKLLMPYIEEECDKLEYEGSAMFDEYPDRTTVRRIQERVREQVQDQFPREEEAAPDEMLSMQYQGRGSGRPGQNWLGDFIQVMLLQEMHHRRCRHRRCRRNRY